MYFQKSSLSLRDRIEKKIFPVPMSGCWIWMGAVNHQGYGQVRVQEGTTLVHRILYEEARGPIPKQLECDHLCRVRCCVNPDHIDLVTRRENIRRGTAPSAKQMAQTHCFRGHPLSGDNLILCKTKCGHMRRCKQCYQNRISANKERSKEYQRRLNLIRKGNS